MHTALISANELHERSIRSDSAADRGLSWVIIDCRFDLAQPEAGAQAYAAGHIPGAIYAHLNRDLSAPVTSATGRHPLPDPEVLATTFGRWGIDSSTQVIAYDADNGAYAARLWWLLRWLGHPRVAVLDGGLRAWTEAGFPVTTLVPAPQPADFVGKPQRELWVDVHQVAENLIQPRWTLIDARAAERFAGKVEPIDPIAGHIPGALNHPFASNLDVNSRFLTREALRERLLNTLGTPEATTANTAVAMCGSGVTACHLLLALEAAGLPGARLYAGSWSEWITQPRPVAQGSAR
jgi:thiosulfate/3-mercaptopyruvate sulfurtransferase